MNLMQKCFYLNILAFNATSVTWLICEEQPVPCTAFHQYLQVLSAISLWFLINSSYVLFYRVHTVEELVNDDRYCTFLAQPIYGFDKLPCKSSELWKM
jgi:hypothetical protein